MSVVIKIENVSKQYRLGLIGTNTLKGDLQRWWYNMRGLPDPTLMIGQENSLKIGRYKSKDFDAYFWALKDINLEVKLGEILGIIGKNGAGKSTLLKLLSKVTAPTTGSIKVKGRIASLLEVGTGFHPDLTGRENIFLNGAILGMTKTEIRNKFDEIVDFSGCELYINTPVKRYSSGMYVRLAFAVAAHLEPEILIVDEVLAVGDAEFQKKAVGKMEDISQKEGRTVLFVSHNMQSVQNLCKKTLILDKGKVVFDGETNLAIRHYNSSSNKTFYSGTVSLNKPKVIKVWFKDAKNHDISSIPSGEPFKLLIEVDNPTDKEVEIQLAFWDGFGILLWNLTHQYFNIKSIPPQKRIFIEYYFMPPELITEELFLHVGMSYKGESSYSLVDHVINAASLIIEKRYDIGKQSQGLFRCPVNIRLYDKKNN